MRQDSICRNALAHKVHQAQTQLGLRMSLLLLRRPPVPLRHRVLGLLHARDVKGLASVKLLVRVNLCRRLDGIGDGAAAGGGLTSCFVSIRVGIDLSPGSLRSVEDSSITRSGTGSNSNLVTSPDPSSLIFTVGNYA